MKFNLLDLFKRSTKFDKAKGIILNGADNLYAEKIERVTNNSVTAKTSCGIMASFIIGKGFGEDLDKTIINSNKRLSLRKFGNVISKNVSKHGGVWVHVMYNANHTIDRYNVLPYTHCRLGKKDSENYNGKVVVYDNWDGSNGRLNRKDFTVIDVFNPREKIIQSQIKTSGGLNKYKGQVLYYNLDEEFDYALGTIDTVINDADSERQASIFKNRGLRRGFFGKTLMVTKPLVGEMKDYNTPKDYHDAVNERDDFKDTAESFLGAENNGGILHVELEHQEEKLEDAILVKSIPSDIDDKMFAYTESSVFKNILMAFNNIPTGLVRSESALFSNSGESLQVMKETYQDNTEYERNSVEELIQGLMKHYKDDLGEINIIPLIEENEQGTVNNED